MVCVVCYWESWFLPEKRKEWDEKQVRLPEKHLRLRRKHVLFNGRICVCGESICICKGRICVCSGSICICRKSICVLKGCLCVCEGSICFFNGRICVCKGSICIRKVTFKLCHVMWRGGVIAIGLPRDASGKQASRQAGIAGSSASGHHRSLPGVGFAHGVDAAVPWVAPAR